ncbi:MULTISPECIES: hypothetical protein [Burkholderia]|uniref:hypothetical protein n=1 Tax=Burkholderia TaxID=32008 RepID=UPI000CFE4803|nr:MULTISPECIES: hypothetical protein [Burkholderia]MDN7542314.1 hypothetical protein [Burkholderia cenocepacia]PRE81337.1 hypothetical protein C6Q13_25120 [Burkholderia gladioli]
MTTQRTSKRGEFNPNWPVPDEYLLELGRMVSVWGSLESMTAVAISMFAGYDSPTDPRALTMVAHSNFQQRVDIVSSLCGQLVEEYPHIQNYEGVIKKIRAAQAGRNKYAHNALSLDEDGQVHIAYMSARGTFKTTVEVVRLAEIKEVTAKIHEAVCALQALITNKPLKPMWQR